MKRLLAATRSPGKTKELREIFRGTPWALVFPDEFGLARLVGEDEIEVGDTFEANALLKARYFAGRSGLPTIADDSGLEVDALAGAPGVYSARWAGVSGPAADESNNRLLLERLEGVPADARTARYRCVAAYVSAADDEGHCEHGSTEGWILSQSRGENGFGYDPLFHSTELGMSFGEAAVEEKRRVSHRGRAFRALLAHLGAAPT